MVNNVRLDGSNFTPKSKSELPWVYHKAEPFQSLHTSKIIGLLVKNTDLTLPSLA
jgi:hypothetical protein